MEDSSPQRVVGVTAGRRSIGLVTQGFHEGGGGVTSVARWLDRELKKPGEYEVSLHVLATSSRDVNSRRIVRPGTWFRRSLRSFSSEAVDHWGASLVEIETMRYRPRRELTRVLDAHDVIQVVAGSPALANVCARVRRPVVLQMATTAEWERRSRIPTFPRRTRWWHRFMTMAVTRIERRAIARADVVMVENEDMRRYVEGLGQRSVHIAPPGVDVKRLHPPAAWNSRGYLLSLCRLDEPRKGVDRLVRAYSQLRAVDQDAPRLVLAGKGSLPAGIRALIADEALEEWVEVRSDVPDDELTRLFHGASVYWQASHEEGLGISVLEAMACGLPVVATDTAGTRQSVEHGVTGWLVIQRDEEALIEEFVERTVGLLLSDGADFGAAGRQRAELVFGSEVTAAPFLAAYSRLLDRPGENVVVG